ncbi:SRPBCC family protein [Streptomyces griseosporeus]|jgi:carbon monoxide dehydrogenase subunit G|uniref:SRPBCC family protein n=1 Tax=Streptomyces griseosporeus TaxID=1910 RepID=UPI003679622F
MQWTTRVEIEALPEDVWQVVSDVERWPDFLPTVRRVERVGGGELGPGSLVRISQPRMPVLTWRITEWTPGRSFTWQARSGGVTTTATHVIAPRDGGSTLTLGIDQTGLAAPLVGLLTGRQTRRYVELEATHTKRRAEQSA